MLLWTTTFLASLVAAQTYPPDVVDQLAAASLPKVKEWLAKNPQGNCTLETAVRRKEWMDLTLAQRKEYTNAVLCLMSKPALTSSAAPGAKSRFDDYIVVHVQQTPRNHGSTFFLPWHRYYVWHYEQALRNECGYKGYQPYWNWDRYHKDPANSPLFDGSEGSMGGNGAKANYNGIMIPGAPRPYDRIPPADGGGCVTTGPFKNMTVNLGPIAPILQLTRNPRADGLGYNPRCLRRDINKNSAAVTSAKDVYDVITKNNDTHWFQTVMEGGHYTVGGDPGGDFYTSPGDPAFWLHHTMIDRVWWIWQIQNLEKRLKEVSHTRTMSNFPPSANGTLDDLSGLGVLAPDVEVRELMSTMGGLMGKFCYIYE
ncbi:uncharacterized protein QC763_506690 [Podospora pseudopauciseta]|uniref:Tyrosinase copper-binding domain-containing protein n=2 Tax=Podospora TaxID=5144 RepID=A0ABR0H9K2_9PEZI|nr:hypothetical protein QC763_506690 [Podospora pseudopauciseta]KAK4675895.1 hypothetical protein QC764_506690 [Podospora pseudoanserina]